MAETILKEPFIQNISTTALKILIAGYARSQLSDSNVSCEDFTDDLFILCSEYYKRPLHMAIFDNKELKLTLLDAFKNDTGITSTNVMSLHDGDEAKFDVGALKNVGVCYKQNINVSKLSATIAKKLNNSDKYNAIFKVGGVAEKTKDYYNWNGSKCCDLILYPQDITPSNFYTYYYKLSDVPFDTVLKDNDPVYSDKFGLISIGQSKGQIGYLNTLKWNIDTLPSRLRFDYHYPPNYCLVNNTDSQLFIINGAISNSNYVEQTALYNMETKKYKILKNNDDANALCGIAYNYNTNRVFIGGGNSVQCGVYYYDLHKNEYCDDLTRPKYNYRRPMLHLNEQGSILYIAAIDAMADKTRVEWVDLRANNEWDAKWIHKKNIYLLAKKVWQQPQLEYLSLLNFA